MNFGSSNFTKTTTFQKIIEKIV